MRKTKIVCSIGPASEKREILTALINAGLNVTRHNFSHGDHEEHGGRIKLVKELREELNKSIAIMLDTKGPEIRTGKFALGKVELKEGDPFTICCGQEVTGDETKCSVSYEGLYKDVVSGNKILIDDGLVELEVVTIDKMDIQCAVLNSGFVGSHKGINVPGVSIKLPSMTDKDRDDLKFGIEIGVDVIAASFVRKASDVVEIRKVLEENGGSNIQIFSKIENQEGIDNIDEILEVSDGIMVARGDLGVEIPIEQLPHVQKLVIEKCNAAGKPVITATQMLDSMIRNPRPTRAEASDIANAILDGTDCIMLSGETANGKYPVEAVKTMAKIALTAEEKIDYDKSLKKKRKKTKSDVPKTISLIACHAAADLNAVAIITITETGTTASMVSRYRPKCPIIAVTPYVNIARRLALTWGVMPIVADEANSTDKLVHDSVDVVVKSGYANVGDLVIIASGMDGHLKGSTNMIKVNIIE